VFRCGNVTRRSWELIEKQDGGSRTGVKYIIVNSSYQRSMKKTELIQSIYYIFASILTIITIIKILNWDSFISIWGLDIIFSIPWYGYFILLVIVLGRLIWSEQRNRNITSSRFTIVGVGIKECKLGEIQYKGVIWNIMAPIPSNYENESEYKRELPNFVSVSYLPRCPHCKIELEERKSLFFGYNWLCIGCGFKKWNKDSFYLEKKRVEKIARRECEKDLENN
jgi:ribosomal protein L37AE/L43A